MIIYFFYPSLTLIFLSIYHTKHYIQIIIQKMLIKNIELVDHVKEAKHKLYSITKLLNIFFEQVNPIYLFILHVLVIFPYISVIFITENIFPESIASVLRVFLFSNLISNFGLDPRILTISILIFTFTIVLLTVLHCTFSTMFSFCSKMLSFLTKIGEYLMVPFINYSAYCFRDMQNQSDPGFQTLDILTFIFINFSMVVILVLIKFQIRMLRKKNTVWNINNDIHFYAAIYLIFKTYFISFYGTTISICFLSIVVFYFLFQMKSGCINKIQSRIERSTYYVIAATDFTALVSLLTKNPFFGLYLWILIFGSIIIFITIQFYIKRRQRIYIPLCTSPPEEFYNFYYNFKEEFKTDDMNNGNKKNFKNIYSLHRIHCKNQCLLNPNSFKQSDQGIQQQISQLIAFRKNQNINNRLIHQLWNLELGHKCQIQSLADKTLTFKQDFILYSIEKLTKDSEATMKSSQSNKNVISKVFYDLIYQISSHYSLFYQELARTHPKIDSIINLGIDIRKKVDKLKQIYSQLLKTRLINFKMIELYLQFFTNFVNENVMDKQSVNRLMKVQQHMHFDDIAENYLPTFTIYPDTGNIQNANSEAQKFLQCTRFQLKYRNISDILNPSVSIQHIRNVVIKPQSEAEEQPVYSFLKKSENEYACGKISIQERYIKQKKLFVLQIIKQPYSSLKNMFLVSDDFKIELMLHQSTKIKLETFRNHPVTIQWHEIFDKYVKNEKNKLIKTKMAKVQTDYKGCLIIIKKLNSINQSKHLLLAQIIVSNENKDRKESILQNRRSFQIKKQQSKFQFHYVEDEHNPSKILLYGYKQPSVHRARLTTRGMDQGDMVSNAGERAEEYGKDIKTYRLYDGQLYNIDLEDKQGYNDLFQEHVNQSKRKQVSEQSSLQCYIFLAVIVLGIVLISFSVVLIISFQNGSVSISSSFTKYQGVEQFSIDFQRILSILRDQYSGLAANFTSFNPYSEINQSYSRIQILKNQNIFDNTEYTINFQNLTIIGTLSQLVDVILAHVTEVSYTRNYSIILDIHNTCIGQLNTIIAQSQVNIYSSISDNISNITFLKNVIIYSSMGIIILLYFFMITFCVKSNYKAKEKLTDLMYISDSEARLLQDNAEKMKYAVEMARKNFDVDTQNLLVSVSELKKRKNPKEAILSRQIVYTIGAITVIGLIIHLSCLFLFSQEFTSQINNFLIIEQQGIAIQSLFSDTTQLSTKIYHNKLIDYTMLNQIRDKLTFFDHQIQNLLFSKNLNNFIYTFFFDNSCALLKDQYNFTAANCANTCPGFTIVNPFEIGVALYLHRQNYYISNNLTQNFAHTGIYSKMFARVFTNLTVQIQKEGVASLQNTFTIVALLNGFIILIDCCYIFAFMIIYNYFREQFIKIKEILYFFNNKWKNKKSIEPLEQIQNSESDSSALSEDSRESKIRKRKTTLEKNL